MAYGIAQVINNLNSGNDSTVITLGDSTVMGNYDTITTSSLGLTGGGWSYRLGVLIGQSLNINVSYSFMRYTAAYVGALPVTPYGWEAPILINVSTRGSSAPTLHWYNGGIGMSTVEMNAAWLTTYTGTDNRNMVLYGPTADAIFIGLGINDLRGGEGNLAPSVFTTQYQSYVAALQSKCSGVPIIITTQNVLAAGFDAAQVAGMSAMLTAFTGHALPLTPALQYCNVANTIALDTRQAFDGLSTSTYLYDGALHPSAYGYQLQANWMMAQLVTKATATITTTMGTPGVVRQTPILPANWHIGDTFTAFNQNSVGATINLLNAAVARLGGYTLPNVPTNFDVGVTFTAESANTVGSAINALGNIVANLGGGASTQVKANWTPGAQFNYSDQNTVESAINALGVSIALLQSK